MDITFKVDDKNVLMFTFEPGTPETLVTTIQTSKNYINDSAYLLNTL